MGRKFFSRPSQEVAKDLLGKFLVTPQKSGIIVETEAYLGKIDKAAHTYQGRKTPRTQVLYGPAGFLYVYLCYGLYWQLNVTTGRGQCVLIRALETEGKEANGPGKLTRWLEMDKSFYGEDLGKSERIWIEDHGEKIHRYDIVAAPRVGIDYAEEWSRKKLRFYLRNNSFVSKIQ